MSTRGQPYAWNASVYRTSFVFVPGLRFTSTDRGEIETTNWGCPCGAVLPPCTYKGGLSSEGSTRVKYYFLFYFVFSFFFIFPILDFYNYNFIYIILFTTFEFFQLIYQILINKNEIFFVLFHIFVFCYFIFFILLCIILFYILFYQKLFETQIIFQKICIMYKNNYL